MSLPAQARSEPTPHSRALPCDQGWPYVPLYTRTPLFAFFSFFAARFSIRLLAGFFFASFLVSIALLITGSSDWREQLAFCAKGIPSFCRQFSSILRPAAQHRQS